MAINSYRLRALQVAYSQVGTKEDPAGSNDGPKVREYQAVTGAYREPWCASFVQWCFKQAGYPQPLMDKSAYVPHFVSYAKKMGWIVSSPEPGDIVCYDWERDGTADHTGIVMTKEHTSGNGNFYAIEGNTSTGNNSNGGEVMQRLRNKSEVQAFIRVPGEILVPKQPAPKQKKVVVVAKKLARIVSRRSPDSFGPN